MSKATDLLRNNLISTSTELEKIVENSSVELSKALNKKETNIYLYLCELSSSYKLATGYQFGIKRFNSMFVNWENGKATEKSTVFPTITNINNACKQFYKMNGKELGYFPIIRINNDGTIILDCISYIENYYSKASEKKESELTREKLLSKIGKMVVTFNELLASDLLENSDIVDIFNAFDSLPIFLTEVKRILKLEKKSA